MTWRCLKLYKNVSTSKANLLLPTWRDLVQTVKKLENEYLGVKISVCWCMPLYVCVAMLVIHTYMYVCIYTYICMSL